MREPPKVLSAWQSIDCDRPPDGGNEWSPCLYRHHAVLQWHYKLVSLEQALFVRPRRDMVVSKYKVEPAQAERAQMNNFARRGKSAAEM